MYAHGRHQFGRIFKTAFIAGLGFAAGILTLSGVVLIAQSLTTFVPGNVVSATEMNANFLILNTNLQTLATTTQSLDTRLSAAENTITRIAPIGTILAWHKSLGGVPALPAGWVQCDGQVLSDAASLLNGQTIPNLNAGSRFLRGSATSGTLQTDAFQGHFHYRNPSQFLEHNMAGGNNLGGALGFPPGAFLPLDQSTTGIPVTDGGNGTPRTAAETRPVNMSVVWIMRVK